MEELTGQPLTGGRRSGALESSASDQAHPISRMGFFFFGERIEIMSKDKIRKQLESDLKDYPLFMSITQIAKATGMHHHTVWQEIAGGRLRSHRLKENGRHRVMKSEVIRWLTKRMK